MNKIFFSIFVAFSVLYSVEVLAQDRKNDRKHFDKEAFEARRNAFITAEVGLTPEEAAEFIPLCDELRKRKFEAGRESRKLSKGLRKKENPTVAEYEEAVEKSLEAEVEEARLEKEYYTKFKRILSAEKIYKYRDAEMKFYRQYMKERR